MSLKEILDHFKQEGPVIKKTPFSFASCVLICGIVIFVVIKWHYSGTLTENSATIRTITEERDAANRENEKLRNKNADYMNVSSAVYTPPVIAPPETYTNGISILRATDVNGWPVDGQVITFHQSDGVWFQINNQYTGNGFAFRTGRSSGWGAWQYPLTASGLFNPAGSTFSPDVLNLPESYPQGISLYRALGEKGWPMDGQVLTVYQNDGVWFQWNNQYTGNSVAYRSGRSSGWGAWRYPVVSDAGGNVVNSGNFTVSQNLIASGGVTSFASNTLPVTTISVGASPFGWTNNASRNILVFVNGRTTSVAINGKTVFAPASNVTIPLQTNEWITVTYTLAPQMNWKPF